MASPWPVAWQRVAATFFGGDPLDVAPQMLGLIVARRDDAGVVRAGRVVEVEAYLGERDPASHAFRGPTPRTQVMFGPPGHLYVYRSYGIHWCANVVCDSDGTAGAVLLRALAPLVGIDDMWRSRPKARRERDLMSGPGKLCAALGITRDDNGVNVTSGGDVAIFRDATPIPNADAIAVGTRVGISQAVDEPWRWWDVRSPHVSSGRGASPRSPHNR